MLNADVQNRAADLSDELSVAITSLLNLHSEYKGSWQHHEIYHYFPKWVRTAKTKDELSFRVHLFCDYLNKNSTLNSLVAPIPFPIPQLTAATLSWSSLSERLKKEMEMHLAEKPNEAIIFSSNQEVQAIEDISPTTTVPTVIKGWLDTIKVKINQAHEDYQPRWYGKGWSQDPYFAQMPRLLNLSQDPLELRFLLNIYAQYLNQNSTINSTVNLLGSWFPKITQSISGSRLAQTLTDISDELSNENIALYTTANGLIHPSQCQENGRVSPASLPDLEYDEQPSKEQPLDTKLDSNPEAVTNQQTQVQAQEVKTTDPVPLSNKAFREKAKEEARLLKEAAKAERLKKQEKEKKEKELEKKKKAFEEQQKKEKEREAKSAKDKDKDKELQRTRSNSNNASAPIDIPLRRNSDSDRLADVFEEASPSPEIFSSFKKFFKLRSSPPKPEGMELKNTDEQAVAQSSLPSNSDIQMQEATKLHLML